MKVSPFLTALFGVLVFGVFDVAHSQCVSQGSVSDIVAISVVFEFQENELKANWIYDSLKPRLQLQDQRETETQSSTVANGELNATFCIEANKVQPLNSKIYFLFGIRKLEANVRPIQWRDTGFTNSNNTRIREGTMPTIKFLKQPSPDWLVVKDAHLSATDRGFPRIEIELHNLGSNTHPGVWISYSASRRRITSCMYPEPRFAVVPVSILVENGRTRASSGDPQSQELISREVRLDTDPCTESWFYINLGPTGAIEGKGILRIRYAFQEKASDKSGFSLKSFSRQRTMSVDGDRVYPSTVRVW